VSEDWQRKRNVMIIAGAALGFVLVSAALAKQRGGLRRDTANDEGGSAPAGGGTMNGATMPADAAAVIPEPPGYAPA
jgi:hypothetical protein